MRTKTSGRTRVAGVVGDPVAHSLSPAIHNRAYEVLGLDWTYVAFPVAGGGERIVEAMRCLSLAGLNVTMPFKEVVARTADRLAGPAAVLGVANTLYWDSGEIVGASTDGDGFVDSLVLDSNQEIGGRSFAVLGAGGAARGVIEALGRRGAGSIWVINRTQSRAESACELASVASLGNLRAIEAADVVINATPTGMAEGDSSPVPSGLLRPSQVVVDLIYSPANTPLLVAANESGATTIGGIGMLVRQAGRSFELFAGRPAPVEEMLSAALAESNSERAI